MTAGKLLHIIIKRDQKRVIRFGRYADQFISRTTANDILKGN